jgi:hypothetical protein
MKGKISKRRPFRLHGTAGLITRNARTEQITPADRPAGFRRIDGRRTACRRNAGWPTASACPEFRCARPSRPWPGPASGKPGGSGTYVVSGRREDIFRVSGFPRTAAADAAEVWTWFSSSKYRRTGRPPVNPGGRRGPTAHAPHLPAPRDRGRGHGREPTALPRGPGPHSRELRTLDLWRGIADIFAESRADYLH